MGGGLNSEGRMTIREGYYHGSKGNDFKATHTFKFEREKSGQYLPMTRAVFSLFEQDMICRNSG